MTPRASHPASTEALFRFLVVSDVLGQVARGQVQAEAVESVVRYPHLTPDGHLRAVGKRTVYRWLKAFREGGIGALEPAARKRTDSSVVLPDELLAFLAAQREADPRASIPQLLARARQAGVIAPTDKVHRSTVWRAMVRMGLETRRRKTQKNRDARRFAYPNRMQMLLCDGKHFRAGATRAKRVALFFLDDATRYGLHVVVGPSERADLFLHGLYQAVRRHGLFDLAYLDHGPGFIANGTAQSVANLGAMLILGTVGYPSGRGKIEKFNQTAKGAVLQALDGNPAVDPDCGALTLRLQHYLAEIYNQRPHEGIGDQTPWKRWHDDPRPLRFPESDAWLRSRFVVYEDRVVTNDNVVSLDGAAFEVPRGHSGQHLTVHRRLLDDTFAILHDGRLVQLHPVDLAANANARRGRLGEQVPADDVLAPTAAGLAFQRDLGPIVGSDGGFSDDQES